MASWSTKRKSGYFFGFIILVALVVGLPSFLTFYKPATCSDSKQNQGERGVDCGGPCSRLCPADYAAPRVKWSYSMKIVPSIYSALAYVENPNQIVEAKSLPYIFKLYDSEGLLVAERSGSTFVPAGQKFAVFEAAIDTGKRVPARTTFEFTSEPTWRPGTIFSTLRTTSINVDQIGSPKAEANIQNTAVDKSFSNITAFIVLYDKDGNRVAFSKTGIDSIGPKEEQTLYFTWPEPFTLPIVKSEVLFVAKPR
jgi:hypothetical protein